MDALRSLVAILLLAPVPARAALGVNLPVVGRVVGGGNVLYATSVDVTNHSAVATPVTFYFSGNDAKTQQAYTVVGSVSDLGLGRANQGSLSAHRSAHFDDFIDTLVRAGQLPPSFETDGVTGSVLFVFAAATKHGEGGVTARFYNAYGSGLVGVAIKGHDISQNEPQKLTATLRDTTGSTGSGQVYPNLFVNHTGLAPDGGAASGNVTVQMSAVSGATGQPVGNTQTYTLSSGQTITIGHVFQALGVDVTKEDTIVVTVAVTAGNAAIEGLVSEVDNATKDGSAFEMNRADF